MEDATEIEEITETLEGVLLMDPAFPLTLSGCSRIWPWPRWPLENLIALNINAIAPPRFRSWSGRGVHEGSPGGCSKKGIFREEVHFFREGCTNHVILEQTTLFLKKV